MTSATLLPKKNSLFARELARLNARQKAAVETIEGPVMVVAGPGTGKTQVVAMRIAQILSQTHLAARNILALTFTEAGVVAMRQRLESLIGPDAYQVTISTFHGFASDVITTFPYVFGFAVEATQVSDLERLQIIHQIVERNLKLTALRPVRSPTFHVAAIGEAIRKLKQENVSPERLTELAQTEAKEAALRPKLTKLQQESINRTKELNLELATVYGEYQAALKKRSLYDYEDMIILAGQGLKDEADVRAYYQERYQYFVVDEYQDTNNAQNALVFALAAFYPNPNLCVVGDDKQAIYRFQGASVANMLVFAQKYPATKVIALEENYRSTQPILQAASALISHNQHQLSNFLPDIKAELTATRSHKSILKLRSFPTEETQYAAIVEEIKRLQKADIGLSQIAVLCRRNDEVRAFREYALKANLPVAGIETSNLISEPEIQQLLLLLEAISDLADLTRLAPALRLIAPISPLSLSRLARAVGEHHHFDQALRSLELPSEEQQLVSDSLAKLADWADNRTSQSLPELIETILCQSRILTELSSRPDTYDRLELIKSFLNEAKRFSIQHGSAKLSEFLDYISLLRHYRVRLPVHRLTPTLEGVFVATVHGAKGLEFDTVFMPGVSSNNWTDRVKRQLIKLPSQIIGLTDWQESPLEDERRLFYVGLTRAKNHLYLSYARYGEDGRELLPSQFVAEIASHLTKEDVQASPDQAKEILTTNLSPLPALILTNQEKTAIRELITTNPFSFTDYQTYKKCPKQYLLNCVLKFPTLPDARLLYGSMLHRALELFYKQYRSRKVLPSLPALISYLHQAAEQAEAFQGKSAVVAGAEKLLRAYYTQIGTQPVLPVGVEYNFRSHQVMLDDIWLTGKFDRIDPIDPIARTVRVIDYKTGSQAKTRNQIEGKTKSDDDVLKQQLVFYALLTRTDRQFPYLATEFVLQFLDDKHTFREEAYRISEDETNALAKDIAKTYQEIVSLEVFSHSRDSFDQGCELCEIFTDLA